MSCLKVQNLNKTVPKMSEGNKVTPLKLTILTITP